MVRSKLNTSCDAGPGEIPIRGEGSEKGPVHRGNPVDRHD